MELMVPIENKDSIPLYEQIYRYIKTEIRPADCGLAADFLLPGHLRTIFM